MPKISIILPIYNVEKYLKRCVDSILNQTIEDIEIILATDGPESCDKICEEYVTKDNRVKIVSHPGSYGKAFNKSLEIANGEYIGIVETDDWCDNSMFEKMYNKAKENDADVVKAGFYFAYDDENKNTFEVWDEYNENLDIFKNQKFLSSQPSVWSCIYKKDFLTKNNIKMIEDRMAFIDAPFHYETLYKADKYVLLKEPLYYYYQDNENQTVRNVKPLDGLRAEKYAFEKIKESNNFEKLQKGFINSTSLHLLWNYKRMKFKDKITFWKNAREYVKTLPLNNENCKGLGKRQKRLLLDLKKNNFYSMLIVNSIKSILSFIFSIKNQQGRRLKHKIITIFGLKIKIKIKRKPKERINRIHNKIQLKNVIIENLKYANNNKIINNVGELFGFSNISNNEILRKNLTQIEIEIFSYCNRQCWFCPNSFIDRHSSCIMMDESLYLNILNQLKEIDYSKIITYSRYNEPLSNREVFLTRLKQARELCPKAFLRTNSNGDFLNSKDYLDALAEAGLNEIEIQCYLNENEEFSREIFEKRTKNFANRLNLKYHIKENKESMCAYFDYENLNLTYVVRDFKNIANNRGESLTKNQKEFHRTCGCLVPFQHIYVDYNGDCMLCCNLRHDINAHKPFILGNANIERISDIFMNEIMIKYRKLLACSGEQIHPCNSCKFFVAQNEMNLLEK